MDKEALKKFVEENPKLVTMRSAGDGIFVLKYKKCVFYDSLWNEYLEECRGTIVDKEFNVISRPFTKIYNYGVEAKSPVLDPQTQVTAYRKVNGFMVVMTWHNNDILISTTGSTDNDYTRYAREMMERETRWDHWMSACEISKGFTFMFECVHPNDPHIVPEDLGMYFLGWRENRWDSKVQGFGPIRSNHWRDFALGFLNCKYPEAFQTTIQGVMDLTKVAKHEGYVFYTEDGISSKIKSPYYLVSKWVARNPRTDKIMTEEFKRNIDEEYYPLVDAIRADIVSYTALNEQERLAWCRQFLENNNVVVLK